VDIIEDISHSIIKFAPRSHLLGHNEIVPKANASSIRTSANGRVARPPNAFILYRQKHHPVVKAAHPDMHNNQICMLATLHEPA